VAPNEPVGLAYGPDEIRALERLGTIEAQARTSDPAQAAADVRGIAKAYRLGIPWCEPMPCLHFVGFKDDRYWNAVKIFGRPDFYHRIWDVRARQEIVPGDVAVFANGDETMPLYHNAKTGELLSWDDSQQDIIARGTKGIDW
jgi:hypothetical protein